MAVFGIAAAALFLSLIGAAAVLAFAGFKGKDSAKSFGMYLGYVAAVFALLAVLGVITSIGMMIAQGGRDGGEITPMGPGQSPSSGRIEQKPGQGGKQGPAGPRSGNGSPDAGGGSSNSPNASSDPAGDIVGSDGLDPDEEAVLHDVLGDESNAPKQSIQMNLAGSSSDNGTLEQVRKPGGSGSGIVTGRNKTLMAVGSLVASIALGGFAVFLFLWSLDLTGRRPWSKNKRQGVHGAPAQSSSLPVAQSEPVTSGELHEDI